MKHQNKQHLLINEKYPDEKYPNERRLRVILTVCLLSLLLSATFLINKFSFQKPKKENLVSDIQVRSRNPASQFFEDLRSGTLNLEKKWAQKLATVKARSFASVGRPADPVENLQFGTLEGKYALTLDGDKVKDISFVDNPNTEGRPTMIKDRFAFIKKFGGLFDAESDPHRVSIDIRGTKIVETYRIKSSKSDEDTVVSFVLDDMDRLFQLHTEKASSLKYF